MHIRIPSWGSTERTPWASTGTRTPLSPINAGPMYTARRPRKCLIPKCLCKHATRTPRTTRIYVSARSRIVQAKRVRIMDTGTPLVIPANATKDGMSRILAKIFTINPCTCAGIATDTGDRHPAIPRGRHSAPCRGCPIRTAICESVQVMVCSWTMAHAHATAIPRRDSGRWRR